MNCSRWRCWNTDWLPPSKNSPLGFGIAGHRLQGGGPRVSGGTRHVCGDPPLSHRAGSREICGPTRPGKPYHHHARPHEAQLALTVPDDGAASPRVPRRDGDGVAYHGYRADLLAPNLTSPGRRARYSGFLLDYRHPRWHTTASDSDDGVHYDKSENAHFLVDDHPIVRRGLQLLISLERDLTAG